MKKLAEWLVRGDKPKKVRKPLRRTRLLRGSTPVKRVSKKRIRQNGEYRKAVKAHLAEFPVCQIGPRITEAGYPVRCTGVARSVHHVKGRTGALLCDRKHFLSSCDGECHPQWIHETHKDLARQLGLLDK